ncbi:hypothetical protein JD844_028649 [Phrynosoma platyrhinos]|uniref:Cytoplasmic activation/proliferation-associated protein-1 C term domain-containing protein n=1 Tax=Phrynosoma platyrhinos TaxID=52577 RepID=A0ABQ7SI68_PHRPL|nr:hypothetical protein JD844_028649 [Phrynosoma platyrhinos]
MDHIQSEIQPQEFLNRRYLPDVDYTVKPEDSRSWEIEHSKKNELPKSWEMLVNAEEQDQKKQKQESLKPLELVRHQGKKTELSRPWEAPVKEDDGVKRQEVSKPWVAQVRDQQSSPKPWITKVKEEQEQKQDIAKPWTSKAKEELEQKQETSKTWIAQARVESVQKPELVKHWGACVIEETEQTKQEPAKAWIGEETEQKAQTPRVWETSEGPRQTAQQPLQNPPKIWGAGNLVPKEQTGPKKLDLEPKEAVYGKAVRREHRLKLDSDVKQDGKTDGLSGQRADAVRRKESLQSVGETCKLSRSFQNIMQVSKPVHQPAAEFCSVSCLPKDPVLRREKLQDLMTQIQGTYNFMQESLLDFDKPSQSAICSSQASSVDSTVSNEQLSNQNTFPEQPVQTAVSNAQELENFNLLPSVYQTSQGISESLVPQKSEIGQAPTAVSSESEIPLTPSRTTMPPVSQEKAFQSPPPNSSIVNIKAPPFQATQTVFKVNAPLPPRREQDIKENSLHPTGYNQNFSTASTQTPPQCKLQSTQNAEQTAFSQESLSNGYKVSNQKIWAEWKKTSKSDGDSGKDRERPKRAQSERGHSEGHWAKKTSKRRDSSDREKSRYSSSKKVLPYTSEGSKPKYLVLSSAWPLPPPTFRSPSPVRGTSFVVPEPSVPQSAATTVQTLLYVKLQPILDTESEGKLHDDVPILTPRASLLKPDQVRGWSSVFTTHWDRGALGSEADGAVLVVEDDPILRDHPKLVYDSISKCYLMPVDPQTLQFQCHDTACDCHSSPSS